VSAYAINKADFDGDGNLDVVITDPSSGPPSVVVLLGNGDCSFTESDTEPSGGTGGFDPFDLAVADFDKDGDPDVAVTNRMSHNVRIFDNDGTGDLSESQTLGTSPNSEPNGIAAGDFDKDRDTDLVVALSGHGAVRLLENEGEAGFDEGPIFPVMSFDAPRPSPIAVSDFNRDGKLDFATGNLDNIPNPDPDVVAVRLGRGNGNFDGPQFYSSGGDSPLSLAVGNYNLQRGADIAAANQFTNAPPDSNRGNVGVLTNRGNGTFPFEPDVFDTGDEPNDVTAGKLNGGDKVDLATANLGDDDQRRTDTVSVLMNTTRRR
jgi:hypothetical protein